MKYGIVLQAKIDELFIHAVPAFFFNFLLLAPVLFFICHHSVIAAVPINLIPPGGCVMI